MKSRYSNIELLRIFCMFLIIWIHFTGYSVSILSENYPTQSGFTKILPQLIHGVCWGAVNTFILISGYFSIQPNAKSFFRYYLVCAFYSGVLYFVYLCLTDLPLNRRIIYYTLMPFGLWEQGNNWWFIPQYMILYVLSPILNKISNSLDKRHFQVILLLSSIVVFYFGWYRNEMWSEQGLNFINFMFLYLLGRYIHVWCDNVKINNTLLGGGWILSGVTIGVIEWYADICIVDTPCLKYMCQYNSPLCVCSAVCLFMFFKSLNVKNNKTINWFAISALAIYLVHNNKWICEYLYEYVARLYDSNILFYSYLYMLIVSVGLVLFIPILDKVRLIITNPLAEILSNIYYKIKLKIQ